MTLSWLSYVGLIGATHCHPPPCPDTRATAYLAPPRRPTAHSRLQAVQGTSPGVIMAPRTPVHAHTHA